MNTSMTKNPRTPTTRRAAWLVAPVLVFGMAACGDDDTVEDPPAAVDPAPDPGDDPPTDPTMDPGVEDDFDDSTIIGLPVDEAQAQVEGDDRQFRVAEIDGEPQALTMDLVEGRVNVVVNDGIVESVAFIG